MEPRNADHAKNLTACALVVLIGLLAYSNSFGGVFLFDDLRIIVENPEIRTLARADWTAPGFHRRPVGRWSFALNYALGELEVAGFHAFNLTVHLVAGLLLFGIVRRSLLLGTPEGCYAQAARSLAFAIALIWVVHPLQTQGVTYIVQRFESMMAMFYLACLYATLRGSQSSRSWPWYVAAVVACSLGMSTKEVMITAPLIVLLYDRVFLADSWREVFRRRWGVYVGFLPVTLLLIASVAWTQPPTGLKTAGFGYDRVTSIEYLGTQGGVILHYLRLTLWPSQLCLDYLWQVASRPVEVYPACVAVAALLMASFIALRYYPRLGFLGVAFFVILAPTSSVMPIADLAVEHRMYLSLAPLVVLTTLCGYTLIGRLLRDESLQKWVGAVLLVAVVAALAWRTFDRNRDYLSSVAMWKSVLVTSPRNARAHNHLGDALRRTGDSKGAAHHFLLAIKFSPDYARPYNNLGALLFLQNDFAPAKAYLETAIVLDKDYATAHYNLGILFNQQRQLAKAARAFEQAIRAQPKYVEAHYRLGNLLRRQGKLDEAVAKYERVLKINPHHAQAYNNLGMAAIERGEYHQAVGYFHQSLEIQPDRSHVARNLTWLLAACRDATVRSAEEAVRWGERNVEMTERKDPTILDSLAAAYAEAGRWDEAMTTAREAIAVASSSGNSGQAMLISRISSRVQLYEKRQPYRIRSSGAQSY